MKKALITRITGQNGSYLKVYAYWMARNYREGYNLFACNGILFNHESPHRGETFVTRKITRTLARIKSGKEKFLYLRNLAAKRDWDTPRSMSKPCGRCCSRVHSGWYDRKIRRVRDKSCGDARIYNEGSIFGPL